MKLSGLVATVRDAVWPGGADPEITDIVQDSRRVRPGVLFVARPGGSVDGHRFIPDAVAAGAAAVVGECPAVDVGELPVPYVQVPSAAEALAWLAAAFHGFPARQMVMIGVTGTDGKTTTCNLIHSILTASGIKAGLISTINALIGDEALDTGLHVTTPDAQDVQVYLAQMAAAGMTHCVLEATSHGLAQQRVTACEFDLAVVTNITHEHLDFHGSKEAYRASKGRLFENLAKAASKPGVAKLAVLNRDDESYPYLRERLTVSHTSYGLQAEADVWARDIEYGPAATKFAVQTGKQRFLVETSLVGAFNVANCLAAATVALRGLDISADAVQAGIAALRGLPGRMERIDLGQDFTAVVDFAHTPNSLRQALRTARQMTSGRVIVVFGSAGLRDVAKRRWMGEIAAELADQTVITAEDPRTESLAAIMAESAAGCEVQGGVGGKTFWQIPDREAAIRFAVSLAEPGDVVMACGKAHEQSMCFGEVEYPWDDRLAVRAALAGRLGLPEPEVPKLPTAG